MPEVQLAYAPRAPIRWYQRKWVPRLAIAFAILWLGWKLTIGTPPFWYRYQCWKLDNQATQLATTPDQILIEAFPPGAAISHVAANAVQFQNDLWAARSKAGLGTLTSPMLSAAPVFCHSLHTTKGSKRIIQMYSTINAAPSGKSSAEFLVTSCEIPDSKWIFFEGKDAFQHAWYATQFATCSLDLVSFAHIAINGGTVDPTDPSVLEIHLSLDQQIYPIRIHLVDNLDPLQSTVPVLAIEGSRAMMKRDVCIGFGLTGFYDWPIAPPAKQN